MSTELKPLLNTGSRGIKLDVTRYWGGDAGVCYQLTGETEKGIDNYVQLNKRDIDILYHLMCKDV